MLSIFPTPSFSRTRSLDNTITSRRIPIKGAVEGDKNVMNPGCWESNEIRGLVEVILLDIKRNGMCLQGHVNSYD